MILEDGAEVKTYIKKDISNVIEDLERFRHDQILQDKRNKLIENYTPERLDYLDQVAVSIARFENRIVSVSTLFHIPLYFNASRALNRYYQSPDFLEKYKMINKSVYHFTLSNRISKHVIETIKQQSNICKTDFIFLSREYPGKNVSKRLLPKLREIDSKDWFMPPDLYRVTNGTSRSCWQYILIKQLKSTEFKPMILNKSIKEEELLQKYHRIVQK